MENKDPQKKLKTLVIICIIFTIVLIGAVIWELIVINRLQSHIVEVSPNIIPQIEYKINLSNF